MNRDTQLALIDRINTHRTAGRGTDTAEASKVMPTTVYTDPGRFDAERRMIGLVEETIVILLAGVPVYRNRGGAGRP